MQESEIKMEKATIMKWIITFVLAFIPLIVPEQGIYTHVAKYFLAVTVFGLSLAAFELAPVFVIAITMPALWISFGVAAPAVVMGPWTGTMLLMIIGAMFLGVALEDCGLLERIAYFLMCKVKGHYFMLLFGIMVTSIILNLLTFGNAWTIMPALAVGLCIAMDGMHKKLGAGLAAAVMLGSCTSHSYTFFAGNWAIINSMGAAYLDKPITPLTLILHCWPLFIVSVIILWVTAKMYKPEVDFSETSYFKEKLDSLGKITRREKVNLAVMALLLIYVFTIDLHHLDLNLGFAIIPWLLYLPFVNGADYKTVQKVNWQMVFFIASCMSIGGVAGSLGLGQAIAESCKTLLSGMASSVSTLALVFGIVFGLNFLMTPMAIFSLMAEPVLMLVTDLGFNALPFAYALQACSEAIILPYEYVPYLVVYGFGMMSMKEFVKWNIVRSALFFIGFLTILVGYWYIIGLF